MMVLPRKSSIVLWLVAVPLLALSVIRPPNLRNDRAARFPTKLAGYTLVSKNKVGKRHFQLHDSNWKSLHPPHICIRGSNFSLNSDRSVTDTLPDGREVSLGRLLATENRGRKRDYVSLYAFVGRDFVTPNYFRFYFEHAPRALFRQATSGFLLRVEAFVGKDGSRATEKRCWKMFQTFLPAGEDLIRSPE